MANILSIKSLFVLSIILGILIIPVYATQALEIRSISDISSIAEYNTTTLNNHWKTINLYKNFINPIVIANPLSLNGRQPAHIRIKNVTSNSFQMKIEEWAYLDGTHVNENVSYMVMEAGSYKIDDKMIKAGTTLANHRFTTVYFNETVYFNDFNQTNTTFNTTPVVLSQSQTFNGANPIVTRNRNISKNGFEVRVQEEEAKGWHKQEVIGYIAAEPGIYFTNSSITSSFVVGRVDNVTHHGITIPFVIGHYFKAPVFLADMQTFNGRNTVELRYKDLTRESVHVFVEEEQSKDNETRHVAEKVGYFTLVPSLTFTFPIIPPPIILPPISPPIILP